MPRRPLRLNKFNNRPRLLRQSRTPRRPSQFALRLSTRSPTIALHTKPKPSKPLIHLLIPNPNNGNIQMLSNLRCNTLQTHSLLSNSMIHRPSPTLFHSKTEQRHRIVAMSCTPVTINILHIRRLALLQRNAHKRHHES